MATRKKAPAKKATTRKATVNDLRNQVNAQDPVDSKIAQAKQEKEEQVLKSVAELKVDKSLQTLSTAGLTVTKALSDVAAELQEKVADLGNVNQAIEIKKAELERLHGVEVVASAIDDLVAKHDKTKKEQEDAIAEERAQWEAADAERLARISDEEQKLQQERQREQAEFEYNLAQSRKKEQDEFEEQKRLRGVAERAREEALQKQWAQREDAVSEREEKVAEKEAELAKKEQEITDMLDKKVGEAIGKVKRDFNTEKALAEKDAEAARQVADLQIKTLNDSLAAAKEQIHALEQSKNAAEQRAQEIATSAVQAASGREALEQVQKAQASQQTSNKR